VQLKSTKVKKWLRVDDAGVVLASSKRDEVEDDDNDDEEKKELERKNKKKKSKKNSNNNINNTKGKDKLKEEEDELARPEAGGDDNNNSKAAESVAAAADLKKTRTTKELEANAVAEMGKEAEFGWSVVRPAEEEWASMLLLVELFAELNAAHGFDEERLAKLAGQLS
jgi:hypothetical protein